MEHIVRKLNWYYYGVMVLTLLVLSLFYYLFTHQLYEPIDPMSQLGMILQYAVIILALGGIPFGLYLVKWLKPETEEKYTDIAILRILIVGLTMPMGIAFFYLLGGYRPMIWVAGMAALAWYFTKPTLGKVERELKPRDPNEETY